jgi:hypothetical protein
MAAYAGMAARAIGHFWFGQPEVAVQAFAAAAIVHIVPNYALTFDQAKEWFEKDIETRETETTTDDIQEIVDAMISTTSGTVITVEHKPVSPAPGTTTTYSKKPMKGEALDASMEKKASAADKSTSTRDGKRATSSPAVSAKRPTEKVTPASAAKPSSSSVAVPLVSTASSFQGWGDYFFGTRSEEQTTSPVEDVTSTSDIETSTSAEVTPPTSPGSAPAISTKSSSKVYLDRLHAKPREQMTTEPIAEITSAVKSDKHEESAFTEAATAPWKTYALDRIVNWWAEQRQGKPDSESTDTVTTAEDIQTPTVAEDAPIASTKPFLGPILGSILGWFASQIEERAVRQSRTPQSAPNVHATPPQAPKRTRPIAVLFAMVTFLLFILLAVRSEVANQPLHVQRLFNFAVGITYTFVVAYLSYFDIPWIVARMSLEIRFDQLLRYLATFQESYFTSRWLGLERTDEWFFQRACWAILAGIALSTFHVVQAWNSRVPEPATIQVGVPQLPWHINQQAWNAQTPAQVAQQAAQQAARQARQAAIKAALEGRGTQVTLIYFAAMISVFYWSSCVQDLLLVLGTHTLIRFICWMYVQDYSPMILFNDVIVLILLCIHYFIIRIVPVFKMNRRWLALYTAIVLARPACWLAERLHACGVGYMADEEIPDSHRSWWSEIVGVGAVLMAIWLADRIYTHVLVAVSMVVNYRLAHQLRFAWRTATGNHALRRVWQNLLRFIWLFIIVGYTCGRVAVRWVSRNATPGRPLQALRWVLKYPRAVFDLSFDTFGPLVHAIICVGFVLVFTVIMNVPLRIFFTWVYKVIKTIAHTAGNSEAWSTMKTSTQTSARTETPAATARMTAVWDDCISPVLALAWETFTMVFRATWTGFEPMYYTVVKPFFSTTGTVLYLIFANVILLPILHTVRLCRSHWGKCLHRRWLLRLLTLVFPTALFAIACSLAFRSYPRRKLRSMIRVVSSFGVPYALSFVEAIGGLECTQDYIIILCTLLLFLFWKRPTQAVKAVLDDGAPDMPGGAGTEVEEAPETVRDGSTPAPVDDRPEAGSESAAQIPENSTASPVDAQPEAGRAGASQTPDGSAALPPLPDSPPSSGSPDVPPAPQTPIAKGIPSALDGHKKKKKSLGAGDSAPEPEVDPEWQKVLDLAFGQDSSEEQPIEGQPTGDEQPAEEQPTEDQPIENQPTDNQAAQETEPNNVPGGWFSNFQPVKSWWDDLRATANDEVEAMDRRHAEELAAAEASKRVTWSVGDIAPLAERSPMKETNVQKQLAQKKVEDEEAAEKARLKALLYYDTTETEWVEPRSHHPIDTDKKQRQRQEALDKVKAKGLLNSHTLAPVFGPLNVEPRKSENQSPGTIR